MGGTVHIDEYTHTVTTAERVKRTIGALLKASPLALPRREEAGKRPIKKGCTFQYILFYIIG